MTAIYLIQLVGAILTIAGMIALMASTHLFGTRFSPAEKQRASDEWNRRRNRSRLPISLETITATLFLFGGIGILTWSRFNLCSFLAYWFPPLPQVVRLFLSCN